MGNGWSLQKKNGMDSPTPINRGRPPDDFKDDRIEISQSQTPTTDDNSDDSIGSFEVIPALQIHAENNSQIKRPQSANFQRSNVENTFSSKLTRQRSASKDGKRRVSNLPHPPRRSVSRSSMISEHAFVVPQTPNQIHKATIDFTTTQPPNKEIIQRSITANTWNMERKKRKRNNHSDIIVSDHIRKFNRDRTRSASDDFSQSIRSRNSEAERSLYNRILQDTRKDLSADRRYCFALIQPDRNWILSAETESDCKKWMALFDKLVQGKQSFKGYLVKRGKNIKSWKKRYFVLFENRCLNYYSNENIKEKGSLIGDIDLRHAMWLRLCNDDEFNIKSNDYFGNGNQSKKKKKKRRSLIMLRNNHKHGQMVTTYKKNKAMQSDGAYLFEIATPNRTWIFCAANESLRNAWYAQIRDVFGDKLYFKIYFDSPCHVEIVQTEQRLSNRYAALMKGWLLIFYDKERLNDIRKMTFFSDTIFRNYIRGYGNCICIPLKNADVVQRDRVSFKLTIDDRCWYFNVMTIEILQKWLQLLTAKHVDYSRFEESYSNLPMPQRYSKHDEFMRLEDEKMDKKEDEMAMISPYFKPFPFVKSEMGNYDMKEIEDEDEKESSSENGDGGKGLKNVFNLNVDVGMSNKNKLSWNSDEFQHGLDTTLEDVITPVHDYEDDEVVYDIN